MNYIPLRVKTSYSFLKSLNDIKKMVSYCKEKGIEACGICDCNMFGVMEFYKECIKNDIKPIIGMENKILYPKYPHAEIGVYSLGILELFMIITPLYNYILNNCVYQ